MFVFFVYVFFFLLQPLGSEEKANGHSSGGALFNGKGKITQVQCRLH